MTCKHYNITLVEDIRNKYLPKFYVKCEDCDTQLPIFRVTKEVIE